MRKKIIFCGYDKDIIMMNMEGKKIEKKVFFVGMKRILL